MKKFLQLAMAALLTTGIVAAIALPSAVGAVDLDPCTLDSSSSLCADKNTNLGSVLRIIVNILLFIVAAVAVIMIVIAGIRYTTSGGNANAVSAAKNTLLYAVVGLAVAIFSFAIVNWVVFRADPPAASSGRPGRIQPN